MRINKNWIWIGPSVCDEGRRKEEKINSVWKNVVETNGYALLYSFFAEALDLFREALSCYQNGAYLATVLMCGVPLEATVYKVVAMKNPRIFDGILSYKVDRCIMEGSYDIALGIAKCRGFISEDFETRINKVRE